MPVPREVPEAVKRAIVEDYLNSMSLFEVCRKYRGIPRQIVRGLLKEAEVMRDSRGPRYVDPTPEELKRERDRIKNSWSVEETSRRWVGKSISTVQLERSRALSILIPD